MSEAVYLGHNIGKLFGSASSLSSSLMFASAEPARGRANFLCCHAASDSCVTWPRRVVQVSRNHINQSKNCIESSRLTANFYSCFL